MKESASFVTCLYFVIVGNGSDVGIVLWKELNGATFSTSWLFESLPNVFLLLYLGPTPPINNNKKAGIKQVK